MSQTYFTVPKSYIKPAHFPTLNTYKEKQIDIVYRAINNGAWWTLAELSKVTKQPIQSVSARLRDLRKFKYGNYTILRQKTAKRGVFVYKLEN